ncbi:hypothetical protein [Parapedobacter tibetensis]|uniref:hypothetical protein n=1 Tax=Parapedobacter tibetensis TaxID=2972951 RepID=UPI00214D1AED|nr:hypothetical protein [Parapedobacter tibetensis]
MTISPSLSQMPLPHGFIGVQELILLALPILIIALIVFAIFRSNASRSSQIGQLVAEQEKTNRLLNQI